jgi:hypothetical protein
LQGSCRKKDRPAPDAGRSPAASCAAVRLPPVTDMTIPKSPLSLDYAGSRLRARLQLTPRETADCLGIAPGDSQKPAGGLRDFGGDAAGPADASPTPTASHGGAFGKALVRGSRTMSRPRSGSRCRPRQGRGRVIGARSGGLRDLRATGAARGNTGPWPRRSHGGGHCQRWSPGLVGQYGSRADEPVPHAGEPPIAGVAPGLTAAR